MCGVCERVANKSISKRTAKYFFLKASSTHYLFANKSISNRKKYFIKSISVFFLLYSLLFYSLSLLFYCESVFCNSQK